MSAFLGPIHYWLFKKIKFQDELVNRVIEFTKKKNICPSLEADLDKKYGKLESEPLENIIDGTNIHGWLQERVSVVEGRFAYAITNILESDENAFSELEALFFEIGKESKFTDEDTARGIYRQFESTFLDGMPCDRANQLISDSDDKVVWARNICVHEDHWNKAGGNIELYYKLRDKLMEGMLEDTNLTYEKVNETTRCIERR